MILFLEEKNLQDLVAIGLSVTDAKSEIFSLMLDNYYRGQKEDFWFKNSWKFGILKTKISNKDFYIVNENGWIFCEYGGNHDI